MKFRFIAAGVSVLVSSASFGGGQATPPVPIDPVSWLSYDDYPASAIRAGEHGAVGYRIFVGDDGGVLSCIVTKSSGAPALDNQTCKSVMQRARFTPARDRAGRARPGKYDGKVTWTIPHDTSTGTPTMSMRTTFSTIVGTDGVVGHCGLVMQSRENPPPTTVCESMRETAMRLGIAPHADAPNGVVLISESTTEFNGKPIEGRPAEGLTEIGQRTIRFHVDATGRAVACQEEKSGELFLMARSPCVGDTHYMTRDGTPVETDGVSIDRSGWRRAPSADGL